MASRKPARKTTRKRTVKAEVSKAKPRRRADSAWPLLEPVATPKTESPRPDPPRIPGFIPTPKYKRTRAILLAVAFGIFALPFAFPLFGDHLHFEFIIPVRHRFFMELLGHFQKGESGQVMALLTEDTRKTTDPKVLDSLVQGIQKAGPLESCHLLNVSMREDATQLIYFLDFENASAIVDSELHPLGDGYRVESFNVHPVNGTYRDLCRFHLGNRAFYQYLLLLAVLGLLLWNTQVLARCLFTPVKRKWLWVIFILTGFASLTMTWMPDPDFNFSLLTFSWPVAQISKNPLLEPWKIDLTLPFGALIFWWRHIRRKT